jgi:hypothetical protein
MSSVSLLDHSSAVEDPRQSWKLDHPLPQRCGAIGDSKIACIG